MRIACVGGGPAGLFFALCAKLLDPHHQITVFERKPPGADCGWGITYTDDLLDRLHRHDPVLGRQVREQSVVWQGLRTSLYGGRHGHRRSYGFAIGRTTLVQILAARAVELDVQIRYGSRLEDPACTEADLVVAADGANSRIRGALQEQFGTTREAGRNCYIWLGTDCVFTELVFGLERTSAGLIWMHAYPYSAGMSTCVVECSAQTAHGLDLDGSGFGVHLLSEIFAEMLGGRRLWNSSGGEPARWQHFEHVRNERWYSGNVVLLGDAAHTTHFSLGAGTHEALADAGMLARALHKHADLPTALASYDGRRRPRVHRLQDDARGSMADYERIDDFAHLEIPAFQAVLAGENPTLRRATLRDRLISTRSARGLYRRLDAAVLRSRDRRRESANGR